MKIEPQNIYSVLLDVNVCIDVLTERSLTSSEIKQLFIILRRNKIKTYIPACSLDTIYFVLKRMGVEGDNAKDSIRKLIKYTSLAFSSNESVHYSFGSDFKDFEDGLINAIAVKNNIDVIITSNVADFLKSILPIFHPKDFIKLFS